MRQPYMLPEADCERLNRTEMMAVRMMLAVLSVACYAKEDLQGRLDCVPYGNQRMRMAVPAFIQAVAMPADGRRRAPGRGR